MCECVPRTWEPLLARVRQLVRFAVATSGYDRVVGEVGGGIAEGLSCDVGDVGAGLEFSDTCSAIKSFSTSVRSFSIDSPFIISQDTYVDILNELIRKLMEIL